MGADVFQGQTVRYRQIGMHIQGGEAYGIELRGMLSHKLQLAGCKMAERQTTIEAGFDAKSMAIGGETQEGVHDAVAVGPVIIVIRAPTMGPGNVVADMGHTVFFAGG